MGGALVKTIQDMEELYYGKGVPFLNHGDIYASVASGNVANSDAPIITSTTGVYQAVYGLKAWAMFNQEFNAFSVLGKVPYLRSGHRVLTARAGTLGAGGVSENGAVPDSIKPTWDTFSTTPKTVAHTFEVSEVQNYLASQSNDDATASVEWVRQFGAIQHKENISKMLLADTDTAVAGTNFESLDRICCSYAEVTAHSMTASDGDIYSKDRDAAATQYDAYVNYDASADRNLTDDLINTLIRNVQAGGGKPQFFLTGYDTNGAASTVYQNQVRYNVLGETPMMPSVNGVTPPLPGQGAGMVVTTIYGMPIMVCKDTYQDTISRLMLLDNSNPEGDDYPRLCLKIAKPTQYFEAGIDSGTPFATDTLGNKVMYRTMGELLCRYFPGQGKIRDLK